MRIVFMGTSEFAVPSLLTLHEHHEVVAAVTRPDAECGRGRRMQCPPVGNAGADMGIPVLAPEKLTDACFLDKLREFEADLFFVTAFRILPRAVFSMPRKGTVNLHGSLLPDYRGAAPIQWAVINGDTETGLTTFYIEETVDTGDIIFAERISIAPDETAGELYTRMSHAGAKLALRTADAIAGNAAPRIRQPMTGGRPAPKLHKEDGRIDWTRDALTIHNRVRGMNPDPGSYTDWFRGPLKIHHTRVKDKESRGTPGTVADASSSQGLTVYAGQGKVEILELQPPGKHSMEGAAFVRGYRIEPGMMFSDQSPQCV